MITSGRSRWCSPTAGVLAWSRRTAEEWARRASLTTLEAAVYRELPGIVERNREAITRDHPQFWRQAGGYRLDRLARDGEPFDLAKFVVGSEGTLVVVTEADLDLVARPAAQAIAVGHFRSTAEAIAASADAIARDAAAVELMDHMILELSRRRLEYAALSGILEGEPSALLFVTFFGETEAEAAAAVDRLAADWAAARTRLPHAARGSRGRPRGAAEGAQGRSGPADGGQ